MNSVTRSWQVGPALPEELEQIENLIAAVGGDLERLEPEQFIVARDGDRRVIGCVRLKPYPQFYELASLAVAKDWRSSGVGRQLVTRLLEAHDGPVYLICEDDVVDFFRKYGFGLIPVSEMLPGLESKFQKYTAEVGHINVMRRD